MYERRPFTDTDCNRVRTRATGFPCLHGDLPKCVQRSGIFPAHHCLAYPLPLHRANHHHPHRYMGLTNGLLRWSSPPSSSKFCPRVTHKRCATLEWHLPPRNFTLASHIPPPNFALGWLTKSLLRWKALEWHLPPLNFALGWRKKGLLPCNDSFSSKFYPRVAHKGLCPATIYRIWQEAMKGEQE